MFDEFKNSIDFFLRNKFPISRKNFVEKKQKLIERNLKENLYTKDVLEKHLAKSEKTHINVLDIGSKNWFYARGEHEFFAQFAKEFYLDAVELDPYRLYSNFYNRFEVAKYYTRNLKNTNYITGNLLDINGGYDYIVWFLPFVRYVPHKVWGLPKKYFYPEKLLKHAYNLLNPQGQMFIVNQGELEAQTQKEMLDKLGIKYVNLGEISSEYFQYKNKRFGVLINK